MDRPERRVRCCGACTAMPQPRADLCYPPEFPSPTRVFPCCCDAVRALRCQLPRANRFYPPEPPKKTDVRPPQLPGAACVVERGRNAKLGLLEWGPHAGHACSESVTQPAVARAQASCAVLRPEPCKVPDLPRALHLSQRTTGAPRWHATGGACWRPNSRGSSRSSSRPMAQT